MSKRMRIGLAGRALLLAACWACWSYQPPGFRPLVGVARPLAPAVSSDLGQEVRAALRAPALRHAQVGLIIQELRSRRVLYQQNPDQLMLPASNMKLLTGACALAELGPQHRLTTTVQRTGVLQGGVLTGNLYLQGGGDPSLTTDGLHDLVLQLRRSGLQEVRGNLFADESLFDEQRYNVGWALDDEGEDYAMPVGALALNRNVVHFVINPAYRAGERPAYQIDPPLALWTVINEARTVRAGSDAETTLHVDRDRALPLFWIRGQIPVGGAAYREDKAVVEPADYALNAFAEDLLNTGLGWQGDFGFAPAPKGAQVVATHLSAPLAELVRYMNKESDNHTAEQLLRLLGVRDRGLGTAENGVRVVRRWLEGLGGDPSGLVMNDGSGLSRRDYVTPRNLLVVLDAMAASPQAAVFRASLPLAGVDGTLKDRLRGTAAAGRLAAKTGTMSHVSSLSGYFSPPGGPELALVMVMNGFPGKAAAIREVQDRIVLLLAKRRPG